MLKAFFDDSGSGGHPDSKWLVMAGYIATAATWERFTENWAVVLSDSPPIPYFHAFEAESLKPEGCWSGVTKTSRDEKVDRLIRVIRSCPVQPISIRMKISNYDRIMKGQSAEHWDDPYYPMLHLALMSTPLLMERFGGDHQLGFVFDTHQKFKRTSEGPRYYQSLLPILGDRVSPNVHYENDEDFPPLQAADLLAWQVRRSLCATQEAPRRHLRDLKTTIDPRFPIEELEVSQELMETWIRKYGEYVFDLVRAYKAQLGDGERES